MFRVNSLIAQTTNGNSWTYNIKFASDCYYAACNIFQQLQLTLNGIVTTTQQRKQTKFVQITSNVVDVVTKKRMKNTKHKKIEFFNSKN